MPALSAPTPKKILFAGDVHGDSAWFKFLCQRARREGCDTIVQLGDLGYGIGDDLDAQEFPARIERQAARHGLNLFFIDGNHDNFDVLLDPTLRTTVEGFRVLTPHVHYIPRATRWQWQGISFLALGGAYSIDVKYRLAWEAEENKSRAWWWPEERITQADVYRALEGGEVDVMLTHDCPFSVAIPGGEGLKEDYATMRNRQAVQAVVEHARPLALLHGHWHRRFTATYRLQDGRSVRVNSLGMNGDYDGFLIVELAELAAALQARRAAQEARP